MHEDRTILTRGLYYRAAEDAPCVNSATYLVSRDHFVNRFELEYGEWEGEYEYDIGLPPHILPRNEPIGGNCLEQLRPSPSDDDQAGANRGRCVHLTTRQLCGNVPLFANFSLAYETGIITYYRNVRNYVTKDMGEGEWSGAVDDLAGASTRVRVTENDDQEFEWQFAICAPPEGVPVDTPCNACPPYPPGSTPPLNISVVLGGVPFAFTLPYLGGSPEQWGGGLDLEPGVFITATLYCYNDGTPWRLGLALFGNDSASMGFVTPPDGRPTFLSCTPWVAQWGGFNSSVDFGTPPATDIFGVPLGAVGTIPFTAEITPP